MGTKPSVFVDGSQSTLIMASYLNDLRTLCYELAGDGTNAPSTAAQVRTNLGATALGTSLFTAASAAAARSSLGITATGDAVATAASAAAARSSLGLAIGTDVQAFAASASQAEMQAGTESALRAMSPLRVAQAVDYTSLTSLILYGGLNTVTIPSTTRRIEVVFFHVSTSGTQSLLATLSSASLTEVDSSCASLTAAAVATATSTSGILLANSVTAASEYSGTLTLCSANAANTVWAATLHGQRLATAQVFVGHGLLAFSAVDEKTLTITTVGGTDTFDGSSIAFVRQYAR